MDPSMLRNFWIEVVGVDKPKLPVGAPDLRPAGADNGQDSPQADAADMKDQVMKRLAALTGPFKEAVAANGPGAKHLHARFGLLKTHLAKQQFSEADETL